MLKQYLYAGLIAALLLYSYVSTKRADEGGYNRAVAEYEKRDNEALRAERAKTLALQTDLSVVSGNLAAAQQVIDKRNRTIAKLEDKYATLAQNSELCNLTVGGVVLHNSALGYGYDPGKLESEGRALSTVTGAAFVSHCNGLAGAFERQRSQLNALIDATDKLERVCGQ